MSQRKTWLNAVESVLDAAAGPLHYEKITERIVQRKLRDIGKSATPDKTVASTLSRAIADEDERFVRLGCGYYLHANHVSTDFSVTEFLESEDEQLPARLVPAYGLHWQRDAVCWCSAPKLYGRRIPDSKIVNFASQIGIYVLHDGHRTRYVGRAISQNLCARLKAHTEDHLSVRWDRFSWFGMRKVENNGQLTAAEDVGSTENVVKVLEAVLIEAMEPALNRQRGDGLATSEFLQAADSRISQPGVRDTANAL